MRKRRLRAAVAAPAPGAVPALDFEFFKARVQPIFLFKREGHARCYVCHRGTGTGNGYLQWLSPGATAWDEAQSQKNFESVKRFVVPGKPLKVDLEDRNLAIVGASTNVEIRVRPMQTVLARREPKNPRKRLVAIEQTAVERALVETGEAAILEDRGRRALESRVEKLERDSQPSK